MIAWAALAGELDEAMRIAAAAEREPAPRAGRPGWIRNANYEAPSE